MEGQTSQHRHQKRLVRAMIFLTVLYGCETWTMTKNLEKKINACEMWIWRKMQRISWMEKKTNEEVRLKIGVENDETLQQMAIRRKLGFFGHIIRSKGLEKEMMMVFGNERRKKVILTKRW